MLAQVGQTLQGLMRLKEVQGDLEAALALGRRCVSLFERLFGPDSVEVNFRTFFLSVNLNSTTHRLFYFHWRQVAKGLDRMGNVLTNLYKFDEARQVLDRALKISEAKFGPDHPATADIQYSIGCVWLVQQGRPLSASPLTDISLT